MVITGSGSLKQPPGPRHLTIQGRASGQRPMQPVLMSVSAREPPSNSDGRAKKSNAGLAGQAVIQSRMLKRRRATRSGNGDRRPAAGRRLPSA